MSTRPPEIAFEVSEGIIEVSECSALEYIRSDYIKNEVMLQELNETAMDITDGVLDGQHSIRMISIVANTDVDADVAEKQPNRHIVVALMTAHPGKTRRVHMHISDIDIDIGAAIDDDTLCFIASLLNRFVLDTEVQVLERITGPPEIVTPLGGMIQSRRENEGGARNIEPVLMNKYCAPDVVKDKLWHAQERCTVDFIVEGGAISLLVVYPRNAHEDAIIAEAYGDQITRLTRDFYEQQGINATDEFCDNITRRNGALGDFALIIDVVGACDGSAEVIGLVRISNRSQTHVRIGMVYVKPAWRRHGVARACMPVILREILKRHDHTFGCVPTVVLYTRTDNTASARLFGALGFECVHPPTCTIDFCE